MSDTPFDQRLIALRRERAERIGTVNFLRRCGVEDISGQLSIKQTKVKDGLLLGNLDEDETAQLAPFAENWTVVTGREAMEQLSAMKPASFDLIVIIGELHLIPDPRLMAFALRHLLMPGGRLLGVIPGAGSLPRLRTSMLGAEGGEGGASLRVHPGFGGPSLAELLSGTELRHVVVNADRIRASYRSLDDLVRDLRAMGCTNVLAQRPKPLSRTVIDKARAAFMDGESRVEEVFELLYFAASAPVVTPSSMGS